VALEHARAIASKALGQASGIVLAVHNTPFGDIVDTEDDLQPLVSRMFRDAARAVTLVAAAMSDATFNVEKLAARASQNWITITELADTLARDHGLPFRVGHEIAAALIQAADGGSAGLAAVLREVSGRVGGKEIVYTDDQLAEILSPRHFVAVRKTHGGPAPSETRRALAASEQVLAGDDDWLVETRQRLAAAAAQLRQASIGI
jgi:argininosuccinate lyase